jgi:hypothetical protein
MNPDTQLLLNEIQKLSVEQTTIQKQLADQRDLLERRFIEVDESMDKRFKDADAVVEQRIIDSELCQDLHLLNIEKVASDLTEWRRDHKGVVDDLRLRLSKLDKYWTRQVIESAATHVEPGIFTEPPIKSEQYTGTISAGYTAARPSGHGDEVHHRENEFGRVTTYTHSLVTSMDHYPDPPDPPPKSFGIA